MLSNLTPFFNKRLLVVCVLLGSIFFSIAHVHSLDDIDNHHCSICNQQGAIASVSSNTQMRYVYAIEIRKILIINYFHIEPLFSLSLSRAPPVTG
jgi:hypothetical protein